jgi:hypothetical protein
MHVNLKSVPCLPSKHQSEKALMERDSVGHPQDLLNSLLVRSDDGNDGDYDREKLVTAATLLSNTNEQSALSHEHAGPAERQVTNPRDPLHNPSSSLNAYAEDPPSVQTPNAPHTPSHLISTGMHQTAGGGSHTQPQQQPNNNNVTTLLSLEDFDKLYDVQQARVSSAAPVPIPLPITPTRSDAVPRFNHLCQTRSITHLFTFKEISKGLFSSKVEFGGHVCEAQGPFSSKKQAKEAVAQQANDVLENMGSPSSPSEEEQRKSKAKRKRKSPSDEDDSENWIALLHEFAQKQHHSQPVFRFFEARMREQQQNGLSVSPSNYSCVLNLQARPLYDFGSEDAFFQTKAEAKRVAAKSAVTWLRSTGLLSESSDETPAGPIQDASETTTERSAAQLVVDYSLRLGLSQPRFDMRPAVDQAGGNLYTCTAHYTERDSRRVPQLEGPLCRTPPVYGQKNAKKMCCEALAVLLERVISERME